MNLDYMSLLEQAVAAAQVGGRIILRHWKQPKDIKHKGRIDLVTETDVQVEKALKRELGVILPQAEFLAEETSSQAKAGDLLWIIDPLDGTTNFAHGLPLVAVSIALWHQGAIRIGLVHLPCTQETFTALRGQGAWLNQEPIRVSSADSLEQSLVATGFPYDVPQQVERIVAPLRRVLCACRGVRRMGAAAIDLAYTACGRFDGFYERGLKPWDTAAGWLLVQEAGGRVSRFDPIADYDIRSDTVLASNGIIHADLGALLEGRTKSV